MKRINWQRLATIGLCSSLVINAFPGVTAVAETVTSESSPTVASSAMQESTESSQETTETSREEVTQETEKQAEIPEVKTETTESVPENSSENDRQKSISPRWVPNDQVIYPRMIFGFTDETGKAFADENLTLSGTYYKLSYQTATSQWRPDADRYPIVSSNAGKYKLYEVPIGTENNNILKFVAKRLFDKNSIKLSLEEKRGSYINETDSAGISRFFSVLKYLCGYHALSMDAYRAEYLYSQLKRFYKKHAGKEMVDEGYICLIGHPKLVTKEYIDNLKKLMGLLKGDEDFKVVNIFDVYQTIKKECKLC